MSFSIIFDRFWWSLLITIFLGLVWLKFLDPIVPCWSVGLIFCVFCGLGFFSYNMQKINKQQRLERELEQKAYEELLKNLEKGDA